MSDKQRILIADDSEMNRAILTEMLGEEYEILEAENGQQAIEMIEKNSGIDLLLLDIMMPVKDGFDVLTAMNQDLGRKRHLFRRARLQSGRDRLYQPPL